MKIGICTQYFENYNYGGNLQAYALCHVCSQLGYEVEQISYYDSYGFKKILSLLYRKILGKKYYGMDNFYIRKKAISNFRDSISHSKLYYKNSLEKANKKYDAFIVGSDQVWNPSWINKAYSLSFAYKNKLRIAYAPSLGREKLDENEKQLFTDILVNMDYISVREKQGIDLLSGLTDKNVEWVLDPTLLLSRDEWETICSKKRLIEDDYIFCYFLEEHEKHREIAKEYAQKYNLKIVTLPYLSYQFRKCDEGFGDYQLFDISPADFISLIKYAKYVFTDSFHATVFAHLYEKEFVVFSPEGRQSKVRMDSLTEMFSTTERHFVGDSDIRLEKIEDLKTINYGQNTEDYIDMKTKSIIFLKNALSDKEKIK